MFIDDIGNSVELRLKILVVGESASGTGKTSFIERYVNHRFISAYKPTVGVDFGLKCINYDYKTKCKIQLWDIAGQDRGQDVSRVYYKNAVAALILFDINCKKSFNAVEKWKKRLDDKVLLDNGKQIPCLLIANKCDIENKISISSLGQYCVEQNFCGYYICSAKDGTNVNEAMHFLVSEIVNNKEITDNLLKKRTMSKEIRIEKKGILKGCC